MVFPQHAANFVSGILSLILY